MTNAPFYGEREQAFTVIDGDEVRIGTEEHGDLLDPMAGYWFTILGNDNEELMEVKKSLGKIPHHIYEDNTNPWAQNLSTELEEKADKHSTILGCTGSMACENARKSADKYQRAQGYDKDNIVYGAINGGYHGSVGAMLDIIDPVRNELVIDSPCYKSEEEISDIVDDFYKTVEEIEANGNKVGGFFYEPVMGVRGAVQLPKNYIQPIAEICHDKDILLIADEVTTGMGRTGKWFGSEHLGVEPDIMTLGKGLSGGYYPVSATLLDKKIVEAWDELVAQGEPYKKVHRRGNGLAGTPEGAGLALKTIEILERDNMVEKVEEKGHYALNKLKELERFDTVREVRGTGLLQAVDMRDSTLAGKVQEQMREYGVNILPEGRMGMFPPSYTITYDQIDEYVNKLERSLKQVSADA